MSTVKVEYKITENNGNVSGTYSIIPPMGEFVIPHFKNWVAGNLSMFNEECEKLVKEYTEKHKDELELKKKEYQEKLKETEMKLKEMIEKKKQDKKNKRLKRDIRRKEKNKKLLKN